MFASAMRGLNPTAEEQSLPLLGPRALPSPRKTQAFTRGKVTKADILKHSVLFQAASKTFLFFSFLRAEHVNVQKVRKCGLLEDRSQRQAAVSRELQDSERTHSLRTPGRALSPFLSLLSNKTYLTPTCTAPFMKRRQIYPYFNQVKLLDAILATSKQTCSGSRLSS